MVEIVATGDDIGPEEFSSVENSLGLRLPEDFRAFLLAHNGGRPEPGDIDLSDGSDTVPVNIIYGIGGEYHRNIAMVFEVFKDRIPEGFCPIAADGMGSQFLIGVATPFEGQVFYWDREGEADDSLGETPTMGNMHLVAPSFPEFLSNLYEFVDDED
ncbi:MAG: SMI1/KNR4 family protein [Pseudomonadota bacterium]